MKDFYPHPDLPNMVKKFRQDVIGWADKMGLNRTDACAVLGVHRMFITYQMRNVSEPRISTMLHVYKKMREYEKKHGAAL